MLQDPIIVQHKGYEIGNFIMTTPCIKAISEVLNKPIKVRFETRTSEKLVFDCPFIKSIGSEPVNKSLVLFTSKEINSVIPDYKYLYNKYARKIYRHKGPIPHTYVDQVTKYHEDLNLPNKFCVILRGAASIKWHQAKDPGDNIYKYILKKLKIPAVFVGGKNDKVWWFDRMQKWNLNTTNLAENNIRKVLYLINKAEFVISNDTGLYHVAGALNKKTFVLWKNTNLTKNLSPSSKIAYSKFGNWKRDFDLWMSQQ